MCDVNVLSHLPINVTDVNNNKYYKKWKKQSEYFLETHTAIPGCSRSLNVLPYFTNISDVNINHWKWKENINSKWFVFLNPKNREILNFCPGLFVNTCH